MDRIFSALSAVMNSYSPGREEYESLIRPVRIVSRLIAIWPLESDHSVVDSFTTRCHRTSMIIISAIMAIAVWIDAAKHWDDMNEAIECSLIASAFTLSFVRMINYTIHMEDVIFVVETMRRDWTESTLEERIVLKEKCQWTFTLAKQFIVTVLLALMLFMVAPMIDIILLHSEERALPFRGYFIKNQTLSPVYECVYVCNMILGGLCGTTIAAATSFNLVSTMHGAAKFALLQKRIEAVKSDCPDSEATVIDCVKRHQDAIKFADVLEKLINVLALGQFVISTGLVCFAGFQMTSMIADRGRLMKYVSFLNSAILELFIFSYSGNRLIDESEAVGDSAYAADWIGGPFSKNLQIIMLRAMIPSKITAAKFYDMSLKSFSSVLSTSFSYFTVLQTMNEE